MEKRAIFGSQWLPYVLLAPQIVVTIPFFFLPAGQMLYQSVHIQDAFGGSLQFVGFDNFTDLFNDPLYLASLKVTSCLAIAVAVMGVVLLLVRAAFPDRLVRAGGGHKRLLILPDGVPSRVVRVLGRFIANTAPGLVARWVLEVGLDWR